MNLITDWRFFVVFNAVTMATQPPRADSPDGLQQISKNGQHDRFTAIGNPCLQRRCRACLPPDVTTASSLSIFKWWLKTFLFNRSLDWLWCVTVFDVTLSHIFVHCSVLSHFYSASALLAMQSAVLARGILSVRLSVRLSFRHVPVLCPDEWRYDHAVFSIW